MSASLVGSEMCIRDRGGASRGVWGRGGRSPPARLTVTLTLTSVRIAVSYTHLTLPTICSV
eukprot:12512361-Alexandrium_andersonii.AAC.1